MSRQDSDYLYDIQEAIERIQLYTSGLKRISNCSYIATGAIK